MTHEKKTERKKQGEKKKMSEEKNKPEKTIRVGACKTTIWKNKTDKNDYYTVSTTRVYKDKEDKWQETNSLRLNDLPKMVLALNKAYEYLAIKDEDQENDK